MLESFLELGGYRVEALSRRGYRYTSVEGYLVSSIRELGKARPSCVVSELLRLGIELGYSDAMLCNTFDQVFLQFDGHEKSFSTQSLST
mmetsp:Transcript_40799/g.128522  ORF Transcript_40799/g.128522 Transcript_40799/m.128522 type:complete len:89 (+) Transcript_40799:205-471(+)